MEEENPFECVLRCSKQTRKKILEECREEMIDHNKHLKGMKLNQNYLLSRIADYYLERL